MEEQHLRIARPTARLADTVALYRDGLGLDVIASFDGHDGFDGVMLGRRGAPYHFEFTRRTDDPDAPPQQPQPRPSDEQLVVFYLPDRPAWEGACRKAEAAGFIPVDPGNPYWAVRGRTFEDLDGYRIVLQNGRWPGGG